MRARSFATARLSALLRGYALRLSPQLGLGRASWNRRMQTGGPSPTPVQQAPCSPITRRTGRCPNRLQAKSDELRPQEPLPLRQSRHRLTSLTTSEMETKYLLIGPMSIEGDQNFHGKVSVQGPRLQIAVFASATSVNEGLCRAAACGKYWPFADTRAYLLRSP
jgi:hypothetical protein